MSVHTARKPWWQQATALVTVSTGGVITGFTFVPGAAAAMTSPTSMPLHLLALQKAARPAPSDDTALRSAIVNVASYYLRLAQDRTPAQMEALIWGKDSLDGADHGPSCAAFASLTLELAAQAVGKQSWVTGGSTYPWPLHTWADVRVDPNPDSLTITSILQDAQAHGRWHPLGDGYQPQPGDWVLFSGHVEVVTSYSDGVLDTIGADSLPNFSVNAHSYPDPLADQGVAGFVDNGHLSDGPAPGAARQSTTPAQSPVSSGSVNPARQVQAQGGSGQGLVAIPGADTTVPATELVGAANASAGTDGGGTASIPGAFAAPGLGGTAPGSATARAGSRAGGVPDSAVATAPARTEPGTDAAGAGVKAAAVIPGAVAPPSAAISAQRPASTQHGQASSAPHYRKYAAHDSTAAPGTRAQQDFIGQIAPAAIAAQHRYGVPASVTIAQAIDESGWGTSELAAQYHNVFGIKGTGPAGSVTLPTSEYENGQWVTINASFRVYHNIAESITDHAELLADSGYYQRAMADRAVPDAFANDLTGIYATDPEYGANLIALMRLYNLYRFDTAAPQPHAPAARQQRTTVAPAAAARPAPGSAAIPGGTLSPQGALRFSSAPARGNPTRPRVAQAPSVNATAGVAHVPGPGYAPSMPAPTRGGARIPGLVTPAAPRYVADLPSAVATAFFASAKTPLARAEPLYRDVASQTGIRWELLAACDWMQCQAHPRYSPVHGEKIGMPNPDGTMYRTKSEALAQCASELIKLSAAIYSIDLPSPQILSVRALADAFAAFRWGALLVRHGVSAMEFPYSVAGLTADHLKMHWPDINDPAAPDKPGGKFRMPFGAVPVVLSLKYPATV